MRKNKRLTTPGSREYDEEAHAAAALLLCLIWIANGRVGLNFTNAMQTSDPIIVCPYDYATKMHAYGRKEIEDVRRTSPRRSTLT
jgi:hypothetical protein